MFIVGMAGNVILCSKWPEMGSYCIHIYVTYKFGTEVERCTLHINSLPVDIGNIVFVNQCISK